MSKLKVDNFGHLSNSVGETYCYWTSTTYETAGTGVYVWYIDRDSSIARYNYSNDVRHGIRPVITINKSIIL